MPDNTVTVTVKNVLQVHNGTEVILESDGKNFSLYTGHYEGAAISHLFREEKTQRPMTHDLCFALCKGLGGTIRSAVITKVEDGVFFGRLIIDGHLCEGTTLDCRPSDMIALALIAKVPIEVVETVFQEAVNAPARLTIELLIEGEKP